MLANLRRRALYAIAVNDKIENLARSRPELERRAYKSARRYVAGTTLHEALATVEQPILATHDPVLREAPLSTLERASVAMLLGVREDDATSLVERGVPVRIYTPFGDQWFRYWLRRVAEARGA